MSACKNKPTEHCGCDDGRNCPHEKPVRRCWAVDTGADVEPCETQCEMRYCTCGVREGTDNRNWKLSIDGIAGNYGSRWASPDEVGWSFEQSAFYEFCAALSPSLPVREEPTGWIPVSERLPEVKPCGEPGCPWCTTDRCCNSVLVIYKPGHIQSGSRFQTCATQYLHKFNSEGAITHWMPLPASPSVQNIGVDVPRAPGAAPEDSYPDQTVLHDERNVGNCLQATIAGVLGWPLAAVPHFALLGEDHWWDCAQAWLSSQGYWIDYQPTSYAAEGGELLPRCWLSGRSPRGFSHAVIGDTATLQMLHDPHPTRAGLVEHSYTIYFFRKPACVLVPREPTPAMLDAGLACHDGSAAPEEELAAAWRAMVNACGVTAGPALVCVEVLRQHWLRAMECDHATGQDKPHCSCSQVDLGWHPSIGAAVEAWLAHVSCVDLPDGAKNG